MDNEQLQREFWEQVKDVGDREQTPASNNRKEIWDYFFRDHYDSVGDRQLQKIASFRKDKYVAQVEFERKRSTAFKIMGVGIAGLVIALLFKSGTLALLAVLVGAAGGGWLALARTELQHKVSTLDAKIAQQEEVFRQLRGMIPQFASDLQVDEWLNRDSEALQATAMLKIGLQGADVLARQGPLLIRESGFIQPSKKNGRASISPQHLSVWRIGDDGRIRFGTYYNQYVFLTQNHMGVYGCFHDFVRGEQKGHLTDEYFYKDVVSVTTKSTEQAMPWSPGNRILEATQFSLTVSSGDSISVTVADEVIEQSLNEHVRQLADLKLRAQNERNLKIQALRSQIEAGKKAAKDVTKAVEELNVLELRKEHEVETAVRLQGEMEQTRAAEAIKVIRQMLKEKKT